MINNIETGISLIYKSPFTTLLTPDLDKLLDTNFPTIIAGDMNSKHSSLFSRISNSTSYILFSYVNQNGYSANQFNYRPNVLDITIMKNLTVQFKIHNMNALSSDHNSVQLILN